MKKIISLLLVVLLLAGCNEKKKDVVGDALSIMCPSGAPALAFYGELDNLDVADALAIKTQLLTDNGPDIAVLPVNVAVSLLNGNINYKMSSIITFGNFYLVDTSKDDDGVLSSDDNIVLFSQGSIPDLLFHFIYGDLYDKNISYLNSAADALREIVNPNSNAEYVMIAEPLLTVALEKNPNIKVHNSLRDLYYVRTNKDLYQACILVKNGVDVNDFLEKIENDINMLIDDPELLNKTIEANELDEEEAMAIFGNVDADIKSIKNNNAVGIGYVNAYDNKEAIDEYLKLFGIEKSNEEIYYK